MADLGKAAYLVAVKAVPADIEPNILFVLAILVCMIDKQMFVVVLSLCAVVKGERVACLISTGRQYPADGDKCPVSIKVLKCERRNVGPASLQYVYKERRILSRLHNVVCLGCGRCKRWKAKLHGVCNVFPLLWWRYTWAACR